MSLLAFAARYPFPSVGVDKHPIGQIDMVNCP